MTDDENGIGDRLRATGGEVVSGLAGALISSAAFGQAVSAAATIREKALDAQREARGLLNLSSRDDAQRLERRVRVLSDRLEETEDRLDEALSDLRSLRREDGPEAKPEAES